MVKATAFLIQCWVIIEHELTHLLREFVAKILGSTVLDNSNKITKA